MASLRPARAGPGAGLVHPIEPLGQVRQMFRGDPFAGVAHANHHRVVHRASPGRAAARGPPEASLTHVTCTAPWTATFSEADSRSRQKLRCHAPASMISQIIPLIRKNRNPAAPIRRIQDAREPL